MRKLASTLGMPAFAMKPWHPLPQAQRLFTIPVPPQDRLALYKEVPMSGLGEGHCHDGHVPGFGESTYKVYWTRAAAGGCTPFIAVTRDQNDREAIEAFSLAHLMYEPHAEAEDMGLEFSFSFSQRAADVYIIVVKLAEQLVKEDPVPYFQAFERGFRGNIPDNNKLIISATSPNAAVTREGFVGELSEPQAQALGMSKAQELQTVTPRPLTVWVPQRS